jgi:hypothetical protein
MKYHIRSPQSYILTADIMMFLLGLINIIIHVIGSVVIFIFNPRWHSKIPFMFWNTFAVGSFVILIIHVLLLMLYCLYNQFIDDMKLYGCTKLYLQILCCRTMAPLLVVFVFLTMIGFNFTFDEVGVNNTQNYEIAEVLIVVAIIIYIFEIPMWCIICFELFEYFFKQLSKKYKFNNNLLNILLVDIMMFLTGLINIVYHLIGSFTIFIFNSQWHSKIPFMFYYTFVIGTLSITAIGLWLLIVCYILDVCIRYIKPSDDAVIISQV